MRQVFLYGFDREHHVQLYRFLNEPYVTIRNIAFTAEMMANNLPVIREIYAIDNRPGLKQDFFDTINRRSFEKDFIFYDLVSRDGIRVWNRGGVI